MSTCPHCGKETDRLPARLEDIIGPERMRELIEANRRSREQIAAHRARLRRRRPRRIG